MVRPKAHDDVTERMASAMIDMFPPKKKMENAHDLAICLTRLMSTQLDDQ